MRLETAYDERINHVLNHISANLDGDLSLDMLAHVAHFSAFHFHRIFKDSVGQTLNQYVNRVRVEHAVKLLRGDHHMRVLDAAVMSGYESAAGFSRAFKKQYGISPRAWDRVQPLKERKIGQVDQMFPAYTLDALQDFASSEGVRIEVTDLPRQKLAYIRVDDSYSDFARIVTAHDQLMRWYTAHGGDPDATTLYGMSQDDPDVTPLEQCRFDWALAVPDDWHADGAILTREMPACRIVYAHVQGDMHTLDRTWQYLWRFWLPRSRYQPANWPAMEIYQRMPTQLGWQQYDMWCSVPIIDL